VIVERDGVALHVEAAGAGEAVVLLHGHTLDLRVWDDLLPALVRGGWRAIRYDQRGHGRSASPPAGYRWCDHAADLAAVLEATGATPAHLVGLSKGAGIALEFALRRPELIASLVLVAPMVPDYPLSAELIGSFRELARRIRSDGVQPAMRQAWLAHPLIASAGALPGVRERLEAMVLTFPGGEYLATTRDTPDRGWKLVDRLGEIAARALVIVGERDIEDFHAMARSLATGLRDARLEVVAASGHLVPLERPDETARLVLGFFGALR
jgi:pimeloyl-ACP methyl ester carboxylesterase